MKLFNSLTGKKEPFAPLNEKEVKLYVCGITPYDTTHLGHAFTYVTFDVLRRYLTYRGYKVIYTQNVTDIDDDILKRAKEEKRDWRQLGNHWTEKFLTDMKSLNVIPPTHYVRATNSIASMIYIIEALLTNKLAYAREGTIFFDISKFPEYGKLSGYNENQMKILLKDRGGNPDDPKKKNPLDFVLWQKSNPSEPYWESPWGRGRPGWHIECSAMVHDYLGEQIDIHGGGRDLIYPHHESEIAQSESFTGKKPYVQYWIHVAMLMYQGEKMSKSLGNLIMVSDLLKKYSADAIRWVLLSHYYRLPWEFQMAELEYAQEKIRQIKNLLSLADTQEKEDKQTMTEIDQAMEDDLNIPDALTLLWRTKHRATLLKYLNILGFSF